MPQTQNALAEHRLAAPHSPHGTIVACDTLESYSHLTYSRQDGCIALIWIHDQGVSADDHIQGIDVASKCKENLGCNKDR